MNIYIVYYKPSYWCNGEGALIGRVESGGFHHQSGQIKDCKICIMCCFSAKHNKEKDPKLVETNSN